MDFHWQTKWNVKIKFLVIELYRTKHVTKKNISQITFLVLTFSATNVISFVKTRGKENVFIPFSSQLKVWEENNWIYDVYGWRKRFPTENPEENNKKTKQRNKDLTIVHL